VIELGPIVMSVRGTESCVRTFGLVGCTFAFGVSQVSKPGLVGLVFELDNPQRRKMEPGYCMVGHT
jgi:hypothetical protein